MPVTALVHGAHLAARRQNSLFQESGERWRSCLDADLTVETSFTRANSKGSGPGNVGSDEGAREIARGHVDTVHSLVKQIESFHSTLSKLGEDLDAMANTSLGVKRSTPDNGPLTSPFSTLERHRRGAAGVSNHGKSPRRRSTSVSVEWNMEASRTSLLWKNGDDTSLGLGSNCGFVADTLPFGWPSTLQSRQGLENKGFRGSTQALGTRSTRTTRMKGAGGVASQHFMMARQEIFRHQRSAVLEQVRDPSSIFNRFRKCVATLLLIYDAARIPYVLGFDVELDGFFSQQLFCFAWFWTLEVFFNFLQGYEVDGELISDWRLTSKHYLKSSGFVIDTYNAGLDWSSAALSLLPGSLKSGPLRVASRALRLIRLGGLLRLKKISRFILDQIFVVDVEATHSLVIGVCSMLGFIVLFNHFQVCGWSFIGKHAPTDTGARWGDMNLTVGSDSVPFKDLNPSLQYASIFHWYMSQLTVGNEAIFTTSTIERVYNICGLLFELILGCAVVSALSAVLVNYQMRLSSRTQELRTLHQYLVENHVSHRTFAVALKQARERVRKSSRLTEKDVNALSLLSSTLRSTLRYEISLPFLRSKPMFRLWTHMDPVSAQQLCKTATAVEIMLPHEVLFEAGEDTSHVYYAASGKGDYTQNPDTSCVSATQHEEVTSKTWLCEAALFTHWIHVGSFEAVTPVELFMLHANTWMEHLPMHSSFRDVACAYGTAYAKRVLNSFPPHASWPTDLQVPFTNYGQLVAALDPGIQQVIGMAALQDAGVIHRLGEKKIDLLEQQVQNGESVVFLDDTGQLKRVTTGVSLEIMDGMTERVLTQLGKVMMTGEVAPSCMLPGHRSERGELPWESVKRLLESKLVPLAPYTEISTPKQEIETRVSPDFGVVTEYMQLRFTGELEYQFQIPTEYLHGDTGLSAIACLRNEVRTGNPPAAYVFPGDRAGVRYCFAWLTAEEMSEVKRRPDFITWWLERVSYSNSQADKELRNVRSMWYF